jgi:D-beta-D-heptose 7-phosphate kinase/D-beta-D-heptose 1-phosphate adenosyltransferase
LTVPAQEALRKVLDRSEPPRVLVVGDVMLDRFVWGDVGRISPEAPVPVVRVQRETVHLGGAANVAANLRSMGASAAVTGILGRDAAGDLLNSNLEEAGIESRLIAAPGRETTVKTRIIARAQQVVRVDREDDATLDAETGDRLLREIRSGLADADALVVSDYGKGVVGGDLLGTVLPEARERRLPVVIDPKPRNFSHYQPATVISPNEAEAARAMALEIHNDQDCLGAARAVLDRLRTDSVLVTRGERGMLLLERAGEPLFIPATAREVYDVTGAGDTVVAVLAMALGSGASLEEAARLANHAAALVVAKVGTAWTTLDEIRAELGPTA